MTIIFDWVEPYSLAASRQPDSRETLLHFAQQGIKVVISLTEKPLSALVPEIVESPVPGLVYCHFPTPDGQPLPLQDARLAMRFMVSAMDSDSAVLVHCREGMGRTGTLLHYFYLEQGLVLNRAIDKIRECRPDSEWVNLTDPQRTWLANYALEGKAKKK